MGGYSRHARRRQRHRIESHSGLRWGQPVSSSAPSRGARESAPGAACYGLSSYEVRHSEAQLVSDLGDLPNQHLLLARHIEVAVGHRREAQGGKGCEQSACGWTGRHGRARAPAWQRSQGGAHRYANQAVTPRPSSSKSLFSRGRWSTLRGRGRRNRAGEAGAQSGAGRGTGAVLAAVLDGGQLPAGAALTC